MGGINSTPDYDTLETIPSQTCYILNNPGLSFIHVHSFSPSTSFFQNLNIRPRTFPRELMKEEFSPGDYRFGFNGEVEGIQLSSKADANSFECSAKISFTDDLNVKLSSSLFPIFSLSSLFQCATNILNAKVLLSNIGFQRIIFDSSIVFQCSDYLLIGSGFKYDSRSGDLLNSILSSLQVKNFLFSFSKDYQSNILLSAKYYLNPSCNFGYMRISNPYSPGSVSALGYTFGIENSIAQASICNDLTLHGKFTKQVSPQFIFGAGLSANLLTRIYNFGIELQVETGESL